MEGFKTNLDLKSLFDNHLQQSTYMIDMLEVYGAAIVSKEASL